MSSSFANLANALMTTLAAAAGVEIVYHRGDDTIDGLIATPGRSTLEVEDGQGGLIQASSQDWMVKAAELVMGDEVILPERGDYITRVLAGQTQRFDVMSTPYRPMDNEATQLRIFTKRTS